MSAFYVGRPLTGSFRARTPNSNVKGHSLERDRNKLYLVESTNHRVELTPIDEGAYDLISNFSEDTGDYCKSVYRIEFFDDIIVVILYLYDSVKELLGESDKLIFHLRADDEDKMASPNGLAGITVESRDDIPDKLSDLFVTNNSVFLQPGKRNGEYIMLGDECWGQVLMEKPGVYVIDQFHKKKQNNVQYGIHQIFGNISFMLREEAMYADGNTSVHLPTISYGEVFEAWDQYMDYQEKIFHEQRKNFIYWYKSISINGAEVSVELHNAIDLRPLYGIDFEYLPGIQTNYSSEKMPNEKELDLLSKDRSKTKCFLGTIKNEDRESRILRFSIPRQGILDFEGGGLIYLSGRSLEIEQKRRRKTIAAIKSGKYRTLNNILRLSEPSVTDIEAAGTKNPVNKGVLKQMFGTDQIELKPNYTHAMDVALNTPDIALIQGPPGTGKTTLIKGLLARINHGGKGAKILLSSEQHDAMNNLINRFSDSGIMPPYVSSTRFEDDDSANNTFEKSVERYQDACLKVCEKILESSEGKQRVSELVKKLTAILIEIRIDDYSENSIKKNLPEINNLVSKIGCADKVQSDFIKLEKINRPDSTQLDPMKQLLLNKIHAQRTELKSFLGDDGVNNFESLQSMLKRQNRTDELFPTEASDKLKSKDPDTVSSVFKDYVVYVNQLINRYEPRSVSEFEKEDIKASVENIRKTVSEYVDREDYSLEGIVEKFQYLLEDEEVVSTLVRKYTSIVGSTCAQAGKLQSQQNSELFDYVIIDEAARANPLDIMIPLAFGKKILMVGDHKQLPHYIETQNVKQFSKEGSNSEILTRSMFQIIYENLEEAKKDGRIIAERTAMIEEQHRMHPVICKFISDTFYDSKLTASAKTEEHKNNYGICDGKNIGVINVPFNEGAEENNDSTYSRPSEARKIIDLTLRD